MIGILVFIIFALAGINGYIKKSASKTVVKVVHVIIMFMLFFYFFGNFKTLLWDLIEEGSDSFLMVGDHPGYPKRLDKIGSIVLLIGSIYGSGLFLKIVAQGKNLKTLLWSIPGFWLITSIDLHKALIINYAQGEDIWSALSFVAIITAVFYLGIFIFYFLKQGKLLFMIQEKKIKD